MTTAAQRKKWAEKRAVQDARKREAGRHRVAVWITAEHYGALLLACETHSTSLSEEIEAAISLNRKMRVRSGNKPL